jgi:hypothetical protein
VSNQYGGFDILRIDDSFYDGFSLVNPEGEIFHEVKIATEFSPGWSYLLQEAEELVETARGRRAILDQEQKRYRSSEYEG